MPDGEQPRAIELIGVPHEPAVENNLVTQGFVLRRVAAPEGLLDKKGHLVLIHLGKRGRKGRKHALPRHFPAVFFRGRQGEQRGAEDLEHPVAETHGLKRVQGLETVCNAIKGKAPQSRDIHGRTPIGDNALKQRGKKLFGRGRKVRGFVLGGRDGELHGALFLVARGELSGAADIALRHGQQDVRARAGHHGHARAAVLLPQPQVGQELDGPARLPERKLQGRPLIGGDVDPGAVGALRLVHFAAVPRVDEGGPLVEILNVHPVYGEGHVLLIVDFSHGAALLVVHGHGDGHAMEGPGLIGGDGDGRRDAGRAFRHGGPGDGRRSDGGRGQRVVSRLRVVRFDVTRGERPVVRVAPIDLGGCGNQQVLPGLRVGHLLVAQEHVVDLDLQFFLVVVEVHERIGEPVRRGLHPFPDDGTRVPYGDVGIDAPGFQRGELRLGQRHCADARKLLELHGQRGVVQGVVHRKGQRQIGHFRVDLRVVVVERKRAAVSAVHGIVADVRGVRGIVGVGRVGARPEDGRALPFRPIRHGLLLVGVAVLRVNGPAVDRVPRAPGRRLDKADLRNQISRRVSGDIAGGPGGRKPEQRGNVRAGRRRRGVSEGRAVPGLRGNEPERIAGCRNGDALGGQRRVQDFRDLGDGGCAVERQPGDGHQRVVHLDVERAFRDVRKAGKRHLPARQLGGRGLGEDAPHRQRLRAVVSGEEGVPGPIGRAVGGHGGGKGLHRAEELHPPIPGGELHVGSHKTDHGHIRGDLRDGAGDAHRNVEVARKGFLRADHRAHRHGASSLGSCRDSLLMAHCEASNHSSG
nr:MAG TPA: hypothetical protein [Caudoviricetes sp.]